jgi:hypothetical protein
MTPLPRPYTALSTKLQSLGALQSPKRATSQSHQGFVRKWLSTTNRSPRSSAPRHPVAMASTAKPPDPMPSSGALAAVLLPESRAHGCHMQKTLFPGTYWVHARTCVLGPCLHAGCASASWVRGGSRGNNIGAGRLCLVPRMGGVRWETLLTIRTLRVARS